MFAFHAFITLSCFRVEGQNLLQYLIGKQEQADKNKRMKRLAEKDIALLVQQLLEALKYLHDKHIAYLDIKVRISSMRNRYICA